MAPLTVKLCQSVPVSRVFFQKIFSILFWYPSKYSLAILGCILDEILSWNNLGGPKLYLARTSTFLRRPYQSKWTVFKHNIFFTHHRAVALGLSDTSSNGSLAPATSTASAPPIPQQPLPAIAATPTSSVVATPTSTPVVPPPPYTMSETPPLLPRGSHVAVPPSRPLPTSPSHQAQQQSR